MINQDLQTLINENEIGKALKYIDDNYGLKDFDMQLLKIQLLKKINWKNEALKLSTKEIFHEDAEIQYERVLLLCESGKFDYAIKICDKFNYLENFIIQKINILMKMKDYGSAYKLASDEKYINNKKIQELKLSLFSKIKEIVRIYDKHYYNIEEQYSKVTLLTNAGFYNEAIATCNGYIDNTRFVVQKIKILEELGKYEEALKLASKDRYLNDLVVQKEKINVLLAINEYEKALEIVNREEFKNDVYIILQKINILYMLEMYNEALTQYEKALKIPNFIGNQKLLKAIKSQINNPKNKQVMKQEQNIDILVEYITRLYSNKIDIDMIKVSELTEWQKVILSIGYYEKFNKKYGIYYIKQIRNNYKDKEYKILNQLLAMLSSKKNRLFDIDIYQKILNVTVKLSIVENLSYEKEETQTKPKEIVLPKVEIIKEPKKIAETKYIVSIGNKVTAPITSNKEEAKPKENKNIILVKDVLKEEVEEVQKYIYATLFYVPMDYVPKAMKAFDIFENMVYKEATKENVDRVLNLFNKDVFKRRFNFNIRTAKIKKHIK